MLTRAFTKPRNSPSSKRDDENSCRSVSIYEYEDCIFGFMELDVPLIFCDEDDDNDGGGGGGLSLRELLRGSVGVIGEGSLGITEKVVLLERREWAVKRFGKVIVRRGEFGRRIERLAQVSRKCQYLVPITAYLFTKRIKFVVCDYYPMGSLADLLAGARELGHTTLDWKQRLIIILNIARAIAFIHSQSPPQDKRLQLNVHGDIKASNIMINVDFTACLSDYGFTQLAKRVEVSDTWHRKPPPPSPEHIYSDTLSQTSDICNFGIIMLDMLGGPKAPSRRNCIVEKIEDIKNGVCEFFEFSVEGKEKNQASQVLDIALACTDSSSDARPSMEKILSNLGNIISRR
ncbi:unnamed protein product [Camellia sinensis]